MKRKAFGARDFGRSRRLRDIGDIAIVEDSGRYHRPA